MTLQTGTAPATTSRADLIDALGVLDRDPSERFERIVRTARETFGVPLSFVNLLDGDRMHIVTERPDGGPRTDSSEGAFCRYTVQQAEPLVIPDAIADPRYASLSAVTEHGIRFYAGVPLTMPGGVRIGTLCLMDTEPRILTIEERVALVDLARWAERLLADGIERERVTAVVDAMRPQPVEVPGWVLAAHSSTVGAVGGDFHDWSVSEQGAVLTVSVAGLLGDGAAASVLAAGVRGALKARVGGEPGAVVSALDDQVGEELTRTRSFASLFHARVDTTTGVVEAVDAGHGMVLHLAADGASRIVRSSELPVGLHPRGVHRSPVSFPLAPGEALVVATDGVLDLGDGTLDTMTVLGRRLHASRDDDGALDVPAFLAGVAARAEERAEDDVTVLVVARR